MTVDQLIKKLEKIKKTVPRNAIVTVEWESLQSDDYTYSPIKGVKTEYAPLADGDGCTQYTKSGLEVMLHFVVIE